MIILLKAIPEGEANKFTGGIDMTFNFTEEQIMIRDMVREFTKKEVEPRDKWMDENGFDYDLHKLSLIHI